MTTRSVFLPATTHPKKADVQRELPWAEQIVRVEGGWRAFATRGHWLLWKKQR